MAGDRCAGFGYQKVKALVDAPAGRAEAGPRRYTFNGDPRFQRLRRLMEDEWTPQLTSLLDIPRRDLPMIWDADFMLGPPGADGIDSYVLGEINVSSVFPIPDEASAEIARGVADRLRSKLGMVREATCVCRKPRPFDVVRESRTVGTQMGLATDRWTFVLSPRGRSWLTYSFSARARVHQFQRVSEPSGFYSKAFHASLFQCAARPAVKCTSGSPRMHG